MQKELKGVRRCDYHRLNRQLQKEKNNLTLDLESRISVSREERKRRQEYPFQYNYPKTLPITARRADIVQLIRENQVVILSGETGSGKTTQIPKMCLEAGRGVEGKIGCTQPRRIAALSVADRVAEELQDTSLVGTKIRFQDKDHNKSFLKVMTDGVLLAETQSDPWLNQYDTIIIDEAHERSLNIDFLLGILKNLIVKRKDLKLVITSATLDTEKFSKAFGNAPIIEVSGRTFPVEVRYLDDKREDDSLADLSWRAIDEILLESGRGDILVFLPTEQDIKEALEGQGNRRHNLNLLPLYARLPSQEQKKIFQSSTSRKVIFSTNIAETSLTIPGIRYVVDSGLARLARYSPGSGTFGLPVEAVSRSSADQRKGRCGRVEEGICIRLYSEEDYQGRSLYTQPEILRTNLAEVILRMLNLKVKDIQSFPFVDSPSSTGINDGFKTLEELGAVIKRKGQWALTELGRKMARIPADPRLSRMLLQSKQEGCSAEIAILMGALSIQDPREKAKEQGGKVQQNRAQFKDERSDFMSIYRIWKTWEAQKGSLMKRLKNFSKDYGLSFRRMKEWVDLVYQFRQIAEEQGCDVKPFQGNDEALYFAMHRSILCGFLSHVTRKTPGHSYEATRNRQAYVFPGSQLFNAQPAWLVSAEMVRTSKFYLRINAEIDPSWIIDLGTHLLKYRYLEPHWDEKRGSVIAREEVRIYNFILNRDRWVDYGPYNANEARDVFIQQGLIEGLRNNAPSFLRKNRQLLAELERMEHKLRRKDLVDPMALERFYHERIPLVSSLSELLLYIKKNGDKDLLIHREDLLAAEPNSKDLKALPDYYQSGDEKFKIRYRFTPGKEEDGPTLIVPKDKLHQWEPPMRNLLPGLQKEQITAYLKSLPKTIRKQLLPIAPHVEVVMDEMDHQEGESLEASLSRFLYKKWQIQVGASEFDREAVPAHIQMKYALVNNRGKVELQSHNPEDLLSKRNESGLQDALDRWSRKQAPIKGGWKELDFEVEQSFEYKGKEYRVYPSLKLEVDRVAPVLYADKNVAERGLRAACAYYIRKHFNKEASSLCQSFDLKEFQNDIIHFSDRDQWISRLVDLAFKELFYEPLRTAKEYEEILEERAGEWYPLLEKCFEHLHHILESYSQWRAYYRRANSQSKAKHQQDFLKMMAEEGEKPIENNFLLEVSIYDLKDYSRHWVYLKIRCEKGLLNLTQDKEREEKWQEFKIYIDKVEEELSPHSSFEKRNAIKEFNKLLQEYRYYLFAQEIKRKMKVSEKRLRESLLNINQMI